MVNSNVKIFLFYKSPLLLVSLFFWSGAVLVTESADIWITRRIPQECVLDSQNNSMYASSLITCAFQAKAFGASRLGYNYKNCDTYEDPNYISQATMEFGKVMPLHLLEEIASDKKGYTNITWNTNVPEYAVDRMRNTSATSYYKSNPYFIFDLGEVREVHLVRILPHTHYCEGIEIRLGMDLLQTGDFSSYTLLARYKGGKGYSFDVGSEYLSCHSLGVHGRYISIQRSTYVLKNLGIREIEVYASKEP